MNNLRLQDDRKRTYEDVKKIIDIKKKKSQFSVKAEIEKEISKWENPIYNKDEKRFELKEFCGIVLYFFK